MVGKTAYAPKQNGAPINIGANKYVGTGYGRGGETLTINGIKEAVKRRFV